jgi:hypothetical protein
MTASQSTFDAATAGTTLESDNATPSNAEAVAIASLCMSNPLPFGAVLGRECQYSRINEWLQNVESTK